MSDDKIRSLESAIHNHGVETKLYVELEALCYKKAKANQKQIDDNATRFSINSDSKITYDKSCSEHKAVNQYCIKCLAKHEELRKQKDIEILKALGGYAPDAFVGAEQYEMALKTAISKLEDGKE